MNPMEVIGELQFQKTNLDREYQKLLEVLHRVSQGEIKPSELKVDLSARSWSFDTNHDTAPTTEEGE